MFYDLEDPNQFIRDAANSLDKNGIFIAQLMCLKSMVRMFVWRCEGVWSFSKVGPDGLMVGMFELSDLFSLVCLFCTVVVIFQK